ncbi:MAG: hypothetical protein WBA05_01515 [Gordonia sp. (in: high G+C Gram-positive bacteria)]|uniref:hypothetical protein n=1 Tax=Gordonia TaxID=2053 RepID=UPI003264760A
MAASARNDPDFALPEPPYSTTLLADLHAQALDPVIAEHVRSRLAADPRAAQVLSALDRVQSDLRDYGQLAPPLPDHVATRLDALIDDLTRR